MADKFIFYRAGVIFWILSLILVFAGFGLIPWYAIQSVVLIMTAISTFVLGGLSIIYGELTKKSLNKNEQASGRF